MAILGIRNRFPNRKLISFAKRCDCDDVACFEIEKPGKVEIIHDFCDPGWEQRGEYDSFWDWLINLLGCLRERYEHHLLWYMQNLLQ